MTKQYTVTVNGTAYEVTVESVSGGRMASAPVARTASAPVARAAAPVAAPAPAAAPAAPKAAPAASGSGPRREGRGRSGGQVRRHPLHPRGHEDGERDLCSLRRHRFLRRGFQGRCRQPRRRSVRHRLRHFRTPLK